MPGVGAADCDLPLSFEFNPVRCQRCSFTAAYPITSSACARSVGGTAGPSALAFPLTSSLNVVGSWSGTSLGLAP